MWRKWHGRRHNIKYKFNLTQVKNKELPYPILDDRRYWSLCLVYQVCVANVRILGRHYNRIRNKLLICFAMVEQNSGSNCLLLASFVSDCLRSTWTQVLSANVLFCMACIWASFLYFGVRDCWSLDLMVKIINSC